MTQNKSNKRYIILYEKIDKALLKGIKEELNIDTQENKIYT